MENYILTLLSLLNTIIGLPGFFFIERFFAKSSLVAICFFFKKIMPKNHTSEGGEVMTFNVTSCHYS